MDRTILIEETKKILGYTEIKMRCDECKYGEEWEDQGGLYHWQCNYNNICSFSVKAYAQCDKYEKKDNKK